MGTLKWNMIDEIIIQVENLYWQCEIYWEQDVTMDLENQNNEIKITSKS